MKKLSPIVAPGWMSMPVRLWTSSDIMRGSNGTPRRVQVVGDAVDGDRGDPRVAHDDLRVAARRRVAGQRRLHVRGQPLADLRDRLQQLERVLVGLTGDLLARSSLAGAVDRSARPVTSSMRRKILAQRAPTKYREVSSSSCSPLK
jgi:hypothetical protein